ncbi:transporter, major facilitator family protein [Necator americanus]|uniref:Transporter, major facilitator family protein n=2 Tax=cellular organisms TaxID=131567 RepID=W2TY85_NECAM|nr:transporter, major facilitator family protein [Necator americanus]ETN86644.1 transporter, major facilitator family protein [Necator americanus]
MKHLSQDASYEGTAVQGLSSLDHTLSRMISARIDRLPASRSLWNIVVRISLGGFFEVYETALTGFLPVALVSAGVFQKGHQGLFGLPDLASFAFATFLGLFLGALVASWISDRLGRRPVFKWSVVWYAAASFLMLFQTDAAALCVLRFISAIGVGASIVTIDAYLAEVLPRRLRGKGFAVSKSIQYLAVPAAALMAMAVSHRVFWNISGWRWLLMLPVCSGILIFWVTDKLPESPRWLASRGRASEATAIVGDWEGVCLATGYALAAPKVVASAEPESGSFRELFRAPLLSRTLMIIGATCSGTVAYYGFGNWLPSLLEARHVGVTKSLLYSALIALSYPVAPFLFSWRMTVLQCPITDEQWLLVGHLIQPQGRLFWGRPARDPRTILDAILWVVVNDERWHRLPCSFGPPQTAYMKWLQWRRSGVMDKILALLSDDEDSLGRRSTN